MGALRMVDGESVIYVDSELESQTAFDHPVHWAEHPYLFPPFLEAENSVVDISGTPFRYHRSGWNLQIYPLPATICLLRRRPRPQSSHQYP